MSRNCGCEEEMIDPGESATEASEQPEEEVYEDAESDIVGFAE